MKLSEYANILSQSKFEINSVDIDFDQIEKDLYGVGLIIRIHFIALHCPDIRKTAFSIALKEARKCYNVNAYRSLYDDINTFKLNDILTQFNDNWLNDTNDYIAEKINSFEKELQNVGCSDSGNKSTKEILKQQADLYLSYGMFMDSLRLYIKICDHGTNESKLSLLAYVHISLISMFMNDWLNASIYAQKALRNKWDGDTDSQEIYMQAICCAGLADLVMGKFKSAAKYFTQLNVDQFQFRQLVSSSIVCMYGGICALATFDRSELKSLYYNSQFRQFLELNPLMSKAITNYLDANYFTMFDCLSKLKGYLLLDIFASEHVNKLYSLIRRKAFLQFFYPYRSVSLQRLSNAFNENCDDLQRELIELINENNIDLRIDSNRRMVYKQESKARSLAFRNAIEACEKAETFSNMILLKQNTRDS